MKILFVCLFNVRIVGVRAKMGDCALDLCCGSGDLAFLLSEKVGSNGKVCSSIVPSSNTSIVVSLVYAVTSCN